MRSIREDRWVRLTMVAVGVLGLVATALGVGVHRDAASEREREEASAVAATSVVAVLSYRPSTVRSDLRRERTLLGPPFRDDFVRLVHRVIAPAATKRGITTRAKVVSRGVSSTSGRTVTLLMFVNVSTTTRRAKEPTVTGSRLRVEMRKIDRGWRIVGLSVV